MDFIRFSGELFIYYALIALGGGVFTGILIALFEAIGINAESFAQLWLIPAVRPEPSWLPPGWWRPSKA